MEELGSGRNKLELYRFLIQNGFEPIQSEKLLESPLCQFTEDEIKQFLDTYRTVPCETFLKLWIFKLVDQQCYKMDFLNPVFSQVITKKAHQYPENSDYRQVYLLLAKILRGEIPDISKLGERATKILLILIEDLRLKAHSIDRKLFREMLSEKTRPPPPTTGQNVQEQILATLMSMFTFQKIARFMNPLNIALDANQKLMEQIRLNAPDG